MLSRSLGIESGAALGIPLALSQAVGVSFYAPLNGIWADSPELLPRDGTFAISCGHERVHCLSSRTL